MKIVFDARYTRVDHHDGISRYTANLLTELAKLHPVTMLISDHRQLAMLPDLPWQLVSSPTSAAEPLVARAVNKLRPDVVFTPMQTMGSWGRRYALLLTVHDLIYYRNRTPPRDLAAPIRLLWRLYHLAWWPQRMLLNRADGVVTVSNTTAALIAEHDLTRKPVTVVSNAAAPLAALDSDDDDALARREPPTVRRLVYMGSYMPYKNVDTLVRAVATLPGTELHLMSRVSEAERARLQKLAPSALLVFHDGATDAEYAETLRSATALVTASRDEGFGIPLVEAMSVGTPVVVSDIPIFREIGGDAALYFDVDDARDLAAAVTRLDEPEEWQRRSALGLERAATFTWAASARTLLGVLEETVARRRQR
ncbi:mannosyltransferase [Leifsonia sp. Leaf325]|nr:glycosyltransferase family 1 protein [Leifsonia sp. Leaf325]KQQ95278.1 mannosyltransferase [Leifsonia sp. Leaf325]